MKCLSAPLLVIAAAVASICVDAAPLYNGGAAGIPDSYIFVLKAGNTPATFYPKFEDIARRQNGRGRKPSMYRTFNTALNGFAATVNEAALKEILASDEVEYVEQDAVFTTQASQSPAPWHLVRVSQRDRNFSLPYYYNDAAGQGVTAYVLDTGINAAHPDFNGRASLGLNLVVGSPNTDENGHGTYVAGILGGLKHGVAKKVTLVGVKVLDAAGSGSTSGIISGMDWVAKTAVAGKSVVNMSLGGRKSLAVDDAAARLFAKNIPLIVAAGSSGTPDSCQSSPAGAPTAFTVAAIDQADKVASFTSLGSCVDIFAPGVGITSDWIGAGAAEKTLSGSSASSPIVAGVAALYLSFNTLPTASSVYSKLNTTATVGKVVGNLGGAPNLIVYNGGA
ncbi:hypothetical protein BGZ75_000995 [Mortierella antarctica]|nr:hypothetical protein BGZ67_010158 [Mortierella alpina]KAF9987122.1 hypothetical protein BGZ75_000995 [Mortierella antarctica]